MAHKRVSPAELKGKALEDWYRRSPQEVEQEKELRKREEYDAFFGEGWRETRARRPVRPLPVRPASPSERSPAERPRSFLESFPYINGGYPTNRPYPLNSVDFLGGDEFRLADGTLVSSLELERTYAEQTRRTAGKGEPEPARRVLHVDRVPDGTIPNVLAMDQREREDDASCHPFGGWEVEPDDPKRSQRSRDYEAQITRARGLDYVVRVPSEAPVKFDGCAVWDPRRQLLEAKGPGYAGLAAFMADSPKYPDFNAEPRLQTGRQEKAARGRPVDWHVAEKGAIPFFTRRVEIKPNLNVIYTPEKVR